MFSSEKNGSGAWAISNGMRFSRKTAFTKRLIAVDVFNPALEQNLSKSALSFFKIILNAWSDPGTFSVPDESFDADRRSLRYDSFHRMQITFSFPGSYPEGCFRHGYHQKKENCKKYGKNIEIKMAS